MNDNDLRSPSVERDDDDYVRLMAEAYPGPKTDIRAAVMARIAEEEKISRKKTKNKVWTAGNRNRFVRYGGMAACVVLLAALGFRVLPMMMKDAVVENTTATAAVYEYADAEVPVEAKEEAIPQEPEATAETMAETMTEEGGTTGFFKTESYSEPIEEEVEDVAEDIAIVTTALDEAVEECVVEEAVVEEEIAVEEEIVEEAVVEEAPVEELVLPPVGEILTESAAIAESVTEEAAEEETAVIDDGDSMLYGYAGSMLTSNYTSFYDVGGSSCSGAATVPKSLSYTGEGCLHGGVFGNSFHDIPQAVMNLVTSAADTDTVAAWCSENAGSCGMNIYEFLTVFGVSREAFETLYTTTDLWYHHDYAVDLLYGGDRDAVYEYYLNGGDYAGFVKRYFEYELKLDLYAEAGSKAYNTWAAEHGFTSFCQWSLAEFVQDFGVTRERFSELYDILAAQFAETYAGYAVAEYNLDKLYGADADVADSIARGDMGYVTDAMCRE